MNKWKQSNGFIAILVVLMIVLVAGCSDGKSAEMPSTSDKEAQDSKQPSETKPENKVQIEMFTSQEGGFSLMQPEKWNGNVGVVEGKDEQGAWNTAFYLLVNGKADVDNSALMSIVKMTKESYEQLSSEAGPSGGEILAENDKYVWLMTLPQSNPYDENTEEFQKFTTMLVDANFIKSQFKLNE